MRAAQLDLSLIPPYVRAPHIGHKYHLCVMAERGNVTLEDIKDLVEDSCFICKNCGRAAADKNNLCYPEPLF